MSFTAKISNYTTTTGEDVARALTRGVDYTLSCIKRYNPAMLPQFAISVNSGASGDLRNVFVDRSVFELLNVDKQQGSVSYWARPIDEKMMQKAKDSKSIYFATYHDPVYTITGTSVLDIFPQETSANRAIAQIVPHTGGLTIDDSNETIKVTAYSYNGASHASVERFPLWAKELVILHASECILIERLSNFKSLLPTDLDADTTLFNQIADFEGSISYTFPSSAYQDALDKAQMLVDKTASIGDDGTVISAQSWLEDEDEDMVASTLSVASQELSRANAILGEFQAELNAKVTDKSQELQEFQTNLQKKISLYDKIIQKLSTDYQWQTTQLQMVMAKKQEYIQHQLQGGISDTVDEGEARG